MTEHKVRQIALRKQYNHETYEQKYQRLLLLHQNHEKFQEIQEATAILESVDFEFEGILLRYKVVFEDRTTIEDMDFILFSRNPYSMFARLSREYGNIIGHIGEKIPVEYDREEMRWRIKI